MIKITRKQAATGAGVLACACSLVMPWEGLYTKAYKDIVGVTTICYGTTNSDMPVKMGDTKTPEECKYLLEKHLKKYDDGIKACTNRDMPDSVHVAMISVAYNIGIQGFCGSTMARRINTGDFAGACDALLMWNKAGGRVVKGLDNRRKAERIECRKGLKA